MLHAAQQPSGAPKVTAMRDGKRFALLDRRMAARVLSRRELHYRNGASPELDRPAHVRAASGLAWLADRIALIQDDANFIALLDPKSGAIDAVTLPAGSGGRRVFDDVHGNKNSKLDLEACFTVPHAGFTELFALGSGSKALREHIVVLRYEHAKRRVIQQQLIDASSLYAELKAAANFGGSELNIEGAVVVGDALLLFQRGNGAVQAGARPPNAVGRMRWSAFVAYVDSNGKGPPPRLETVTVYDLGEIKQVPYTFTDATLAADGRVLFLASAENSNSTVTDGEVFGTYIGELRADGSTRVGPLLDERNKPLEAKAEGITLDPSDLRKAWVVLDMDDPAKASELLEVRLAASR